MRYGIHLGGVRTDRWVEVAEAADELGFDSVWVPEHLVVPVAASGSPHAGSEHPPIPHDVPVHDPFAVLGHLAARTRRVLLGINVYNIGLRHPFSTARAATTVDVLSGGRMALGVGASWLREEWEAVGLDFDTRGARVDEAIEVCRRLWREPIIEHHGRFFDFGPVGFEPKPGQPGGPALHIGGDGPAALRRARTVGTGWMPMNHALEDVPASLERIGRQVEVTLHGHIGTDADVHRHAAAGVTRVLVRPWTSGREAVEGMARFAQRFVSRPDGS